MPNDWKTQPVSNHTISRQSISTVSCKGSAKIWGTNNFKQQENWKHACHPSKLPLLVNWDRNWCTSLHIAMSVAKKTCWCGSGINGKQHVNTFLMQANRYCYKNLPHFRPYILPLFSCIFHLLRPKISVQWKLAQLSWGAAQFRLLKKCLKNDLIPEFLKFRFPGNGVFSDQAVHNFQLKLLRTETSRAKRIEKGT